MFKSTSNILVVASGIKKSTNQCRFIIKQQRGKRRQRQVKSHTSPSHPRSFYSQLQQQEGEARETTSSRHRQISGETTNRRRNEENKDSGKQSSQLTHTELHHPVTHRNSPLPAILTCAVSTSHVTASTSRLPHTTLSHGANVTCSRLYCFLQPLGALTTWSPTAICSLYYFPFVTTPFKVLHRRFPHYTLSIYLLFFFISLSTITLPTPRRSTYITPFTMAPPHSPQRLPQSLPSMPPPTRPQLASQSRVPCTPTYYTRVPNSSP